MKTSVCLTVFNEEKSISDLLESLLTQTKKPDEIVVVDGGSKDNTLEILRHFQKKDARIKVLSQLCTRSEGRNLSVEFAKNDIIAMTDAGCVAQKDWLKNITEPFEQNDVGIVAGFYVMSTKTDFEKAASVFLGVTPRKFDIHFLPSTRSIAFRRTAWEKVGGFPEDLESTAEDTVFNYKAVKEGIKFSRVEKAIVGWGIPDNSRDYFKKISEYARGDVKSGIGWHPSKKLASHNIKAFLVLLRYILGLLLIVFSFLNLPLFLLLILGFVFYSIYAFRKVYSEFNEVNVGVMGVYMQYLTDFAVIYGFIIGLLIK
jgi:glycosyltransferase involved in cell wall biosynthesis